jgi:hypothetical protein
VYSQYNTMTDRGTDTGLGSKCEIPYSPSRLLVDFMVFHFRLMKWSAYQLVGLDTRFKAAIDYDFFLRFSETCVIQHFPKSLYRYRQHPQTLSSQSQHIQRECAEAAINNALQRRNLSNRFRLSVKDKTFSLEVI